ncbi:MAG: aldehyde dehydrogenase [Actinobacteria bacterium]|nr:aldehyde dehydrogenase [Actinomycetota bacterium]
MFVNGEFVDAATDEYVASIDPTTGEPWYETPDAGAADVDRAVRAARAALEDPAWRDLSPSRRGHILRRVGDLLGEQAERLARIESRDNGKVLREVAGQMAALPEQWEYFAGWPDKLYGSVVPTVGSRHNYLLREPVGVAAAIVPWNSPLTIAVTKMAPALAAGNAVVVKPSEHTAASLLEFVPLLTEAGVPPGVVNVVTGLGPTAGEALVTHPGVDLISLTGGPATGRHIAHRAADRLVRTILELGGKSPNIVFADADPERAAAGIAAGIFAAAGQTCVAGARCFLHEDVYDDVLDRVAARAASIKLGNPLDEETEMGPLAFAGHMERVLGMVERGRAEGAVVRAGGVRVATEPLARGYFVEPTILEGVDNQMTIAREEVFGPVLSVLRFRDEAEVVRQANDTPFGLAAGVWTSDLSRAHRVARDLDAANVWINTYRRLSPVSAFGGFKESGYGKEGGHAAMLEYTREKNVWIELEEDGGG